MRLAGLILFLLTVGAWLVGSVLGRFGVAWGASISFVAGLVLRVAGGLVLARIAVGAAEHGGVWYVALAAALGVVALMTLVLAGIFAWAALKYGIDAED